MASRTSLATGQGLEGSTAWVISDGKAGHEAQCLGVAAALGVRAEIKRVTPSGVFKLAAPWGPVGPNERFGRAGTLFAPPWPRLAFATGRITIPYIRALRRRAKLQTFTVILLDPKTGANSADLLWVPAHDRRRGPNVISTLTSPHAFTQARLTELRHNPPREIAELPGPRVAVLVGGPNRAYAYSHNDGVRLTAAIRHLALSGASLMITSSRRTPDDLVQALRAATADTPGIFWDGQGANPYADFLANADAFVVTADSINMACEAAATGRPIYVFTPEGSGGKFERFHAALRAYGATRPLPNDIAGLESWTYQPLDSAVAIADEIRRRWTIRANILPGLMEPA